MPRSLSQLLLTAAAQDAARPLLCCAGKTWSRGSVADAMLRVTGWLTRADIGEGHRVALLLGNQAEFVPAWLGASLAGVFVTALDPASDAPELAARLDEIDPEVVIARPSALQKIQGARKNLPSLQHVVVTGTEGAGATRWSAVLDGAPAQARPTPDGGVAAAGAAMSRLLGLGAHDRLMVVQPVSSANAQFSIAMALAAGGSLLLERGFTVGTFWSAARKGGATQVSLTGAQLARLYATRPRKTDGDHFVHQVLSTGTPREIHEAFEHRFRVCVVDAYGSDDAAFITVNPVERGRRKLGTAGLPVPWYEVAVLDEQMRPLGPGAIGHICIRPRHTSDAFQGWSHAGAIGTIDEEGFFKIVSGSAREWR